jgi:starvation-inducible DNA-binding protein
LLEDNEQVIHSCRQALKPAKKADDEATIDLLTGRIDLHAKTAWMLRSYLG